MYAGDLAYAGLSSAMPRLNISKEDEFEHIWDLWGIQTQPVAATRPFMVGVGNHERFYEYAAVQNRYKMPFEKSGGNGDFWYSYTYGNVHWISISSEEDVEPDSTQISFLQQDLEKAAANRVSQAPHYYVFSRDRLGIAFNGRLLALQQLNAQCSMLMCV